MEQKPPPKLLDQVSDALRLKHYSYRTEGTYLDWVRRYILFHGWTEPVEVKRRLDDMGTVDTLTLSKPRRGLTPSCAENAEKQTKNPRPSACIRVSSSLPVLSTPTPRSRQSSFHIRSAP
jgi:hypothetical protein